MSNRDIDKTQYPPQTPIFIWDGECGFCKFWVLRLKYLTNNKLQFQTYQSTFNKFPDLSKEYFSRASRLIDQEGRIYSGPDSFYKGLEFKDKTDLRLHNWYTKFSFFKFSSDLTYKTISKNRSLMYHITTILFGKNPTHLKHNWIFYLLLVLIPITVMLFS